jgi:hypothetical protein
MIGAVKVYGGHTSQPKVNELGIITVSFMDFVLGDRFWVFGL